MKEFKCKGCKEVIALTDGKYLYAGGMAFSFKTTGVCLHCGFGNCWRPVIGSDVIGKGLDKPLMFGVLSLGEKNV